MEESLTDLKNQSDLRLLNNIIWVDVLALIRISKCRWAPNELPVLPDKPIRCPPDRWQTPMLILA